MQPSDALITNIIKTIYVLLVVVSIDW